MMWINHPAKRAFDAVTAGILLVILTPLLLLLLLLIHLKMGKPLLFRQVRPGRHAELFTLYKLRSMSEQGANEAERVTPLGKFLRATSLDELPELWNILKGDMSFVGPRPLLPEYLPLYTPEQAERHACRPGLTGWAQIQGRNRLSWEDKFRQDLWYIRNASPWLDLKILLLTPFRLLNGGSGPAEPFTGSPPEVSP